MLNFLFDAGWLLVIKPSNFPLMKMSEIHDLSPTELSKKLRELGDELLHLQLRKQTGQVDGQIKLDQEVIINFLQLYLEEQAQEREQELLEKLLVQMFNDNLLVIVLLIYLLFHLFVQEMFRLVAQD